MSRFICDAVDLERASESESEIIIQDEEPDGTPVHIN